MHIHIALLTESTEPLLNGFDLIPPFEKVYVICNGKHPEFADTIESFLSAKHVAGVFAITDDSDFSAISDAIFDIIDDEEPSGPHSYSLNVTGGSVSMALAAYHAASLIDAIVYLIQGIDTPRLLTIPTVRVSGSAELRGKGKAILRFIHERTSDEGSVSNRDIETEFGMKKQQVSYYVRILRESGLITTDSGVFDIERNTINYRFNSIRLTEKGLTEVRSQRWGPCKSNDRE